MGGGRRARARVRERAARARVAEGRRVRDPRRTASTGRSWTSRSPRSAPSASRCTRTAPRRTSGTSSSTRRRSGSSARTRSSSRRSRRRRGRSQLEHVLTYHDLAGLAAHGSDFARRTRPPSTSASAAIDEEDLYTIIYTSGTTGPPKGCMLSHRNYYAMASVVDEMENVLPRPDDVMLLYLPLAHNFGRLMLLDRRVRRLHDRLPRRPAAGRRGAPAGAADAAPERPARVREGPRGGGRALRRGDGVKRRLIDWAAPVGREVSRLESEGKPIPRGLARSAASPTASSSRRCASASVGACASRSRAERRSRRRSPSSSTRSASGSWRATGSPSARRRASTNRPIAYRFGTVGRRFPGFEVEIADDGEILVRSETVFQGYFKDPEATAGGARPDGWLRTGDIGALDEDGFLHITDRKKDILVTAGGKNVAPQNIENDLKTSKYVSQALVVGDRRPYVAALITLDRSRSRSWAEQGDRRRPRDAVAPTTRARARAGRRRRREPRPLRYEQVKRFAILPRDFTMEHGEITPTLKLRRRAVLEHFEARSTSSTRRRARRRACSRRLAGAGAVPGSRRAPYQASYRLEIFTTSPVCGAWMNWPPPMYIPMCRGR